MAKDNVNPLGLAGLREAEERLFREAKNDRKSPSMEQYAGVVTVGGRIADVGVFYRFREDVKPPADKPAGPPKRRSPPEVCRGD